MATKSYRFIRFRTPIGNPSVPGRENTLDIFTAPGYTITVDDGMVSVADAAGNVVEAPLSAVLYAIRDVEPTAKPKKGGR